MGYLTDNIPPGKFWVICSDLYPYRIYVNPNFYSDRELQLIVEEVIPDVEEWQFSGRRFIPVTPNNKILRNIFPANYAHNSRKMRPYTEKVVFAFHTTAQRALVASRFSGLFLTYELENEPT